jgi:Nucleotidyl transferase AbiEii toxin, Type IV TA system
MAFHPEVMPEAQQRILKSLGKHVSEEDFYLAGGTAIAIHLGHRESVDLDWFTGREISEPMGIVVRLAQAGLTVDVTGVERGTLHGEIEQVKLSFLEYRYPLLRPLVEWSEYGCRLASLEDLACMKLSAAGSRGAKKDFVDLYALGKAHFTLAQMLDLYQEKYHTDILHVLTSLTYFDDAETERTPKTRSPVEWEEIKGTMKQWVADYGRRQAPSVRQSPATRRK